MKKINRVKKAQEFQEIIHKGKKYANASFVLYTEPRKEDAARIGISVPKKFGHAVDRNLGKRQVRMMCQDLIDFNACPMDGILIIRFGYHGLSYEENKKNLEKLFSKATML